MTCAPSFGALCPATLGPSMTLLSLGPGRSLTLTYAVAVPADKRGDIVNQVDVSSTTETDLSDITANYLYRLSEVERNHQAYVTERKVMASRRIERQASAFFSCP